MKSFVLDDRLARDSVFCGDGPLSQLRLFNDRRFPWFLLIPRKPAMREITDLSGNDQRLLLAEINLVSTGLRGLFPQVEKLNIAALGNVVSQLHVHIIGRQHDDAAWPKPVWNFGQPESYTHAQLQSLLESVQDWSWTPET